MLHAVVPIGQAHDVLAFHGLEQLLALGAALKTVHGGDVVEQEGQVEQLHRLGVLIELGQRPRNDLHFPEEQGFQLLVIAIQRGVGVHLHLHLARQPLFRQLLEHQRALALGCLVTYHVGEFDDDRLSRHDHAPRPESQGAGERFPYSF
ncbi:hypothetical protein D3C84_809250 [compost metagenome]